VSPGFGPLAGGGDRSTGECYGRNSPCFPREWGCDPVVEERVSTAVALAHQADNLTAYFGSISRLQVLQSRLRSAALIFERAMQVTPGQEGLHALFNGTDYYFGKGDLLRE
jgi:hypothetical protein